MTLKEQAKAMREAGFTGFDKPLASKIQKPDKYGIRLVQTAQKLLSDKGALSAAKPRKRKYPCRVEIGLTKRDFALLQQAIKQSPYTTKQSFLLVILENEVFAKIKAARCANIETAKQRKSFATKSISQT